MQHFSTRTMMSSKIKLKRPQFSQGPNRTRKMGMKSKGTAIIPEN